MLPDRCHDTTNMTCDNYIFFSRDVFSNGGKKINVFKNRSNRTDFKYSLGVGHLLRDGRDTKVLVK